MTLIRSALAPLAVLLGASLQGCAFYTLPDPVKIAIGHKCDEKAAKEVADRGDDAEAALGERRKCDDLNQTKLTDFEVDCAEVTKKIIRWGADFECEMQVAEKVAENCSEAVAACKTATDDAVKDWKLTKPDESEEDKKDQREGAEALMALLNECHKLSKTFFENPGDSDPIAEECGEDNTDALTAMGVGESNCQEWNLKTNIRDSAFFCLGAGIMKVSADEDFKISDITLEQIQKLAGDFDLSQIMGSEADRLRLYAVTALTSKRWPKKLQPWSNKMVKFGAASVAALAVLVIVGMRRRTQRVEAQDDQLLMNIE